jgi:glycosyltransferase involved in cell wall biosynthesis
MAAIQKRADVLFLPLAFHTPYPELIKVSSPSKVGEFLMCAKPILVHVPSGSFLSRYFREHNCGLVVDRDDPAVLADELNRLLSDPDLRKTLTSNAVARAKVDFNLSSSRQKLAEVFNWKTDHVRERAAPN